jgi:hypothetical protein
MNKDLTVMAPNVEGRMAWVRLIQVAFVVDFGVYGGP